MPSTQKPSLSIVIPARNEAGNIPDALRRLPDFEGAEVEVVFVEGNSTDDTWKVIQDSVASAGGSVRVRCIQQPGKGKNDAVRAGFDVCRNDLLVILDADLTMPPEMLPRFYRAYASGHADFINGSRLVYPMEGEAMRFLNRLGNVFFVKALNLCLENTISDSLCGTKLIARRDYERLKRWRFDFGDFDPFGDFELLYFASILPLGIVDVPIYYRARTYGETNIRRFRDGWILLKMTIMAWFRIRI
jgi:glycosyltransferase involved in cell wall biosynthesis